MSNSQLNFSIRSATVEDAAQMTVLSTQLGYLTELLEMQGRLARIQQQDDHAIFVADSETSSVVGFVHAHYCNLVISAPLVLILGLAVQEAFQRCGVGRSLMQAVEHWALSQNCSTVLARSNIIRTQAHQFYEHIGYEKTKQSIVFCKYLTPPD